MSDASVAPPATAHIKVIDGVRAISILMVIAGHQLPLGPKFLLLNATSAACGMSLFFALSGFLITRLLMADNTLVDFLIKRLARILPLAWLYAAVTFVFFGHDLTNFLRTLGFTLNYHYDQANAYDAHLWSLCVEIHFYLVVGVVFRLFPRQAKWLILALCLGLTALRIQAHADFSPMTHLRGDEILAGALLCLSTSGAFGDHGRFWKAVGWLGPLAALVLLASAHPATGPAHYIRAYAAAAFVGSTIFSPYRPLRAVLTSAPMAYIAKISYALYIFHPATATGVLAGGPKWLLYAVKRPISLGLAFALAHLSTRYYEARWIEAGRRLVQSLRARRAASAQARLAAALIG